MMIKERKWTKEKKDELTRLYGTMNNKELAEKFGVTEHAICCIAHILNLKKMGRACTKRWTREEDEMLRKQYPVTSVRELSAKTGRSINSIRIHASRLGVLGKNAKKELDEKTVTWMRLNYPHMSNAVCGLILGVTKKSVAKMAKRLGLEKTKEFKMECQMFATRRAKESNLKNGTYPPKGWYSPNLQKGRQYLFKARRKDSTTIESKK